MMSMPQDCKLEGLGDHFNGGRHVSPKKNEFPITPPSSVVKSKTAIPLNEEDTHQIGPKELLPALKRSKVSARAKPRLKFRPAPNTLLNLDDYLSNPRTSEEKTVNFIRHALNYSKNIVVVSGAGISVAAGIPDFRSANGLFQSLKGDKVSSGKQLFDFNHVYSSDEMSVLFNKMIVDIHRMSCNFEPTSFHKLLNRISESGRIRRIYTQNIDCLESKLENISPLKASLKQVPTTIQLHGSINHMSCTKCRKLFDMDPTLFKCDMDNSNGSVIPPCPECEEFEAVRRIAGKRLQGVGKLRPYVVLYNEVHPDGERIGEIVSKDLKLRCDCLIIVGTSLKIPGVKSICKQFCQSVRSRKGIILWINRELPSQAILDLLGGIDLIILGDCQDICKIVSI